jgi:hypothetical protein
MAKSMEMKCIEITPFTFVNLPIGWIPADVILRNNHWGSIDRGRGSWTRWHGLEMGVTLKRYQNLVNVSMGHLQRRFTALQEPHPN